MSKKDELTEEIVDENVDEVETSASQPDALIDAEKNVAKDEIKKDNKSKNDKTANGKDDAKNAKNNKKKKEKKPNVVGKKIKETTSEIKKVSWPSFSKVVKQTGIVIAVVIIFTVVLFGIDQLLALLFRLFTGAIA